jgi:hypothetical protein
MEGAVCSTYLLAAVPGRCDDSGGQVWRWGITYLLAAVPSRYDGNGKQVRRWAVPTYERLHRVGVMTVGNRYGGGQYLPTSGCAG